MKQKPQESIEISQVQYRFVRNLKDCIGSIIGDSLVNIALSVSISAAVLPPTRYASHTKILFACSVLYMLMKKSTLTNCNGIITDSQTLSFTAQYGTNTYWAECSLIEVYREWPGFAAQPFITLKKHRDYSEYVACILQMKAGLFPARFLLVCNWWRSRTSTSLEREENSVKSDQRTVP